MTAHTKRKMRREHKGYLPNIEIIIDNRQRKYPVDHQKMRTWAIAILSMEKEAAVEVGLIFVSDRVIRRFNRQYRGLDVPTDVLSFPIRDTNVSQQRTPWVSTSAPFSLLGDVMISLERADAEAPSYGRDYSSQLLFLMIHGLLHLLGYDHEQSRNEARRMQRRERLLFEKIYIH